MRAQTGEQEARAMASELRDHQGDLSARQRLVEQQLQEYRASAETSANLVKELEEKSRSHQKDAERSKAAAERAKSMLKKSTAQKTAEIDAAAAALEQAQALHSSRSEEFDRVC